MTSTMTDWELANSTVASRWLTSDECAGADHHEFMPFKRYEPGNTITGEKCKHCHGILDYTNNFFR